MRRQKQGKRAQEPSWLSKLAGRIAANVIAKVLYEKLREFL